MKLVDEISRLLKDKEPIESSSSPAAQVLCLMKATQKEPTLSDLIDRLDSIREQLTTVQVALERLEPLKTTASAQN
jgi:hypothetical protein